MKKDKGTQFLCKDCEYYRSCEYYHCRKEDSYICKYFHLPNKLDKIRAEIESVIQEETVLVHPEARNGYERVVSKLDPDDVFLIIDKYKAGSEVQE